MSASAAHRLHPPSERLVEHGEVVLHRDIAGDARSRSDSESSDRSAAVHDLARVRPDVLHTALRSVLPVVSHSSGAGLG